MNLIHYWNSTATILLGEVCRWTKIVIVYVDKKLCVKLGTLSVQSTRNVWADCRFDIVLRLLLFIIGVYFILKAVIY